MVVNGAAYLYKAYSLAGISLREKAMLVMGQSSMVALSSVIQVTNSAEFAVRSHSGLQALKPGAHL